jgi:phenylacetate-CoA ligase
MSSEFPRLDLTRPDLDRLQAEGLARLLADVLPGNRFYARKLADAGLDPTALVFPRDLCRLPFTTKDELLASQLSHPPYGEVLTYPVEHYTRLHQTSGTSGKPLRWLDTPQSWGVLLDTWLALFQLAGVTAQDRLFFPFSFGPFLGFWTAFEAGARLGCLCLPGGGMSSGARLHFLLDNAATVVFCTPTYALHLAEVARAEGLDLPASAVRLVVVAGEPGGNIPATRQRIEAGWGARVIDHNGMTETGPLGIESLDEPGGLYLLETVCLPEILEPGGDRPVAPGTEGELVVTTFRRTACPLIRYRTGDRVLADPAPGRWPFLRLVGGIRGRADDMVSVRGNNLHPAALQTILHRFGDVAEYRVVVDQSAALTVLLVEIEVTEGADALGVAVRVDRAIRDELLFRAEVRAVPPGSLPRQELKARRWVRKTTPGALTTDPPKS